MKTSGLFDDILEINERLVRNAESLIINMDNNAAELYNSILAKVVGGKRINYSWRRSYESRCERAAISYNVGAQTSRLLIKKLCNKSPGKIHKTYITSRESRVKWLKTRKRLFPESFKRRKQSNAPADEDYGLPALDMNKAGARYRRPSRYLAVGGRKIQTNHSKPFWKDLQIAKKYPLLKYHKKHAL